MKIRNLSILIIFCLIFFCFNYAQAGYEEIDTSLGKVVAGLSREEAMGKFGAPMSAGKDVWYYASPKEFYVYFKAPSLSIQLYPQFCKTYVGMPLEVRVFSSSSNFNNLEDITSKVRLVESEPGTFVIAKAGVVIPRRAGEYQLLAAYKDIFSNPIYVTVSDHEEKDARGESRVLNLAAQPQAGSGMAEKDILSIEIFPYKPSVLPGTKLGFTALGIFYARSRKAYVIEDISKDAQWFIQKEKNHPVSSGKDIYFSSEGKYNVFCKYKDVQSTLCEVQAKEQPLPLKQTLKYISAIPDFIIIPLGYNAKISAFGTYYNNVVKELTNSADWEVKDASVLGMQEKGSFLAKSEGATELIVRSGRIQSLPVKVKKKKKNAASDIKPMYLPRKKKGGPSYQLDDVNNDVEKLDKDLSRASKKLAHIRIDPDYLKVHFGGEGKLSAFGVYSDRSQEDLTILGDWVSFEPKIAGVSKGNIYTVSPGEVKVYMEYGGIRSDLASIVVEGPKLISVLLSPDNSRIRMGETIMLKAEGYFSDSSRKDITSFVDWALENPGIARIGKGLVTPVKPGKTKVYAEFSGVKSLPANITVIFSLTWLIGLFLKTGFFLIMLMASLFCVFYLLTEERKKKLVSLYNNPREFIIALYENAQKILAIFGFKYDDAIPPLSYAALIEAKYPIEDNMFLKFTVKFEEAKYSRHEIKPDDADSAIMAYNDFLKMLSSGHSKYSLFCRYCLALRYLTPFYIITNKN